VVAIASSPRLRLAPGTVPIAAGWWRKIQNRRIAGHDRIKSSDMSEPLDGGQMTPRVDRCGRSGRGLSSAAALRTVLLQAGGLLLASRV